MKKTFKEMCDSLWEFPIENSMEKTVDEVTDEIKAFVESCGWEYFDSWHEDEWLEKHPEINEDECEEVLVASFERLCKNDNLRYTDRHVDWYEFNIYCCGIFTDTEVNGAFHIY